MIKCPICLCEFQDNIEECPSCGFKFSGSTQKFKPINSQDAQNQMNSTMDRSAKSSAEIHKSSAVLRVVSGPQGEILLPLSKDKITIGRSPNSDIFLNDRTVSRDHAIVSKNGEDYQIVDCDSYNGLWINNQNKSVATLKNDDIIQIGVFFLKFEIV